MPFGNIYSFVDGTCDKSTGMPYLYLSDMDQSAKDLKGSTDVSLALSEASTLTHQDGKMPFGVQHTCSISASGIGDPENPPCARLVVTGKFIPLHEGEDSVDDDELSFAKRSLFQRHPSMADWPDDHSFFVGKIDIIDLWLIDIYGGATVIDVDEYFGLELQSDGTFASNDSSTNLRTKI